MFELVDEWFKKNWNTIKIDANRKAWHNALSSEQFYGLVATEVRSVCSFWRTLAASVKCTTTTTTTSACR